MHKVLTKYKNGNYYRPSLLLAAVSSQKMTHALNLNYTHNIFRT